MKTKTCLLLTVALCAAAFAAPPLGNASVPDSPKVVLAYPTPSTAPDCAVCHTPIQAPIILAAFNVPVPVQNVSAPFAKWDTAPVNPGIARPAFYSFALDADAIAVPLRAADYAERVPLLASLTQLDVRSALAQTRFAIRTGQLYGQRLGVPGGGFRLTLPGY